MYRIRAEFRFPTTWTEVECCEYADAGVFYADWFDDPIESFSDLVFDDLMSASRRFDELQAAYKGPDTLGVNVILSVEDA